MFRIYLPMAFLVIFIIWVLHRLFVKQDLKQQLNNVYFGFFFFSIWGLIYFLLLK